MEKRKNVRMPHGVKLLKWMQSILLCIEQFSITYRLMPL